jgi:hypothetical protein
MWLLAAQYNLPGVALEAPFSNIYLSVGSLFQLQLRATDEFYTMHCWSGLVLRFQVWINRLDDASGSILTLTLVACNLYRCFEEPCFNSQNQWLVRLANGARKLFSIANVRESWILHFYKRKAYCRLLDFDTEYDTWNLNMKAAGTSETLVATCQTTNL